MINKKFIIITILLILLNFASAISLLEVQEDTTPPQQEQQTKNSKINNKLKNISEKKLQNPIEKKSKNNQLRNNQNNQTNNQTKNQDSNYQDPPTLKNYLKLTLKTIDNNKNPVISDIHLETENLQKTVSYQSFAEFYPLKQETLTITIKPYNKFLKTIKIVSKIEKDTNLHIIIPPSKFNITLYLFDLNSPINNQLNFNIKTNLVELKNFQIDKNKIIIPIIEANNVEEYGFPQLDQNEINNQLNKIENIPTNLDINFTNNLNYKDESIRIKITPNLIKRKYPEYKRIIILENKLPNPYINLIPLAILLISAITYLLYKIRKLNTKEITQIIQKLNDLLPRKSYLKITKNNKSPEKIADNAKVSDYILLERLGTGATSVVYKAQNIKTRNIVALKLIHKHLFSEKWFQERIQNEIEINKILTHPNIIRMLDYNLSDNQPFIAFEYVQGKSLSKIMEEKKKIPLSETLEIWIQILEALDYAHQKGIIHRDLKPDNILIKENKIVKITDFGISKRIDKTLNITQDFVGTPWYMSPEQIKNQKTDNRSDIYSLGVIIYQMLTGKLPFETSENIYAVFKAHMFDNPISANITAESFYIPPDIEKIIRKMIEKDPKKRYQYCYEIIQELTPFLLTYSQK